MSLAASLQRLRQNPPRGLTGAVFWLALWFCLFWLLRLLPGTIGTLFGVLQLLDGIALAVLAIPVLWRQIRQRMLWSLRNKLVLTYLLIGVAPVVLFVTLVLISAYIAAGQFAIHLADSRVQSQLDWLSAENANLEDRVLTGTADQKPEALNAFDHASTDDSGYRQEARSARLKPKFSAFVEGVPLLADQTSSHQKVPLGLPPWAVRLPNEGFRGMVLDGSDLYLVAIHEHLLADGRRLSLVSSLPVDDRLMSAIAEGLGRAAMTPEVIGTPRSQQGSASGSRKANAQGTSPKTTPETPRRDPVQPTRIIGGVEPPAVNLADLRVRFASTFPVLNWDSGDPIDSPIEVTSRPVLALPPALRQLPQRHRHQRHPRRPPHPLHPLRAHRGPRPCHGRSTQQDRHHLRH